MGLAHVLVMAWNVESVGVSHAPASLSNRTVESAPASVSGTPIIGPRPNGFLWVNLVRFTTSRVEVWVQKRSGGEIRYYDLPAIPGDSDDLSGLVDKQAFTP